MAPCAGIISKTAVIRVARLTAKRSVNQWVLLSQCYDKLPSKMPLMIREGSANQAIRCGLLQKSSNYQASSTFLAALLADVYAPDQSWLSVMINRQASSLKGPMKIQYGDQFDVMHSDTSTTLAAPLGFLNDHNVEFMEISEKSTPDEDGCHFYLDLDGGSPTLYQKWPTVSIELTSKTDGLPFLNEINPNLALQAILSFIRDKKTVNSYLEDLETSNFPSFSKRLATKLDGRDQIYVDLGSAILRNLKEEDESITRSGYLLNHKLEALNEIETWRRFSHSELQRLVVPLVQKFLKTHLSVWKIYTYSNTAFNLKIKELVEKPLRELQMENQLYKLIGHQRLSAPVTSPLINKRYFEKKLSSVYKGVNRAIYQNFFQLQLPLITCATMGYISEQFSIFSMGSLASLGIVLGLQRVLSTWESASKETEKVMYEDIRANIERGNERLIQETEERFSKEAALHERKFELVRDLSTHH